MTALPVAYYLKELSGDPGRRGRGLAGGDAASDAETQIAEAHARGILEGQAAAQVDHDKSVAAKAAYFEQRLNFERQKWTAEQSGRLGELFAAGLEDVERRIAHAVAEVLKPLLGARVRDRALDEMAAVLNEMISKGEYAKIAVTGPSDLVQALEQKISNSHEGLSFEEGPGVDIKVEADDTILESRLSTWIDTIERDEQ